MKISEFFGRFVAVRKCAGCQQILRYEERHSIFCSDCELPFRAAKVESCPICFQSAVDCTCMPKGLAKTGALCLRKLIFYHSSHGDLPQNKMIYFIKRNPNRRVSSALACELADAVFEELAVLGIEDATQSCVLVGVPRGRAAKNRYGFDQSERIVQALSARTGIPFAMAVRRRIGGREQKKLGQGERFRNIRRLFFVKDKQAVRGKCVLLFDDVVTTGASMAACVKLLQEAGAKSMICLCLAQNQKQSQS